MADQEVSKIMWIAIVVALGASVFVIAKPQINSLAGQTFDKIGSIVKGDDSGGGGDDSGGNETPPEEKATLVAPTGVLKAETSAFGVSDGTLTLPDSLTDSKGEAVSVTAKIVGNSGEVQNGKLAAGNYDVQYFAEGYDSVTQKAEVTQPEEVKTPELVAPANVSLTTPGYGKTVAFTVPTTLKDDAGNNVAVDAVITGGDTSNPTALTKGTYTVKYNAPNYKSVTNTIAVTDKMITPSGLTKTTGGGGKNPTQVISGKASPNSKVEIKYGYPNGSTIDYVTVTTTVDSSGNFSYQLGQYEVPGNITKISARSIYEYSSTDKQMSGWSAVVNV